jgi:hypothetical protein
MGYHLVGQVMNIDGPLTYSFALKLFQHQGEQGHTMKGKQGLGFNLGEGHGPSTQSSGQ